MGNAIFELSNDEQLNIKRKSIDDLRRRIEEATKLVEFKKEEEKLQKEEEELLAQLAKIELEAKKYLIKDVVTPNSTDVGVGEILGTDTVGTLSLPEVNKDLNPKGTLQPISYDATTSELNWDLLNPITPKNFPFFRTTLSILGQFHYDTYTNYSNAKNLPYKGVLYPEFIKGLNKYNSQNISRVKLPLYLVCDILGESQQTIIDLILSGELIGVRASKSVFLVYSTDLVLYIKTHRTEKDTSKYLKYFRVIPHMFIKGLYEVLSLDKSFTTLETHCIFGMNLIDDDKSNSKLYNMKWNHCHKLMCDFDGTIHKHLTDVGVGSYFGTSKVRLWAETYYLDFFKGLLAAHAEYDSLITDDQLSGCERETEDDYIGLAYIEYLITFSNYSLKHDGLERIITGSYNPAVRFLNQSLYKTPGALGLLTGCSSYIVNDTLSALGYQKLRELSPIVKKKDNPTGGKVKETIGQWVPTDEGEPFVYPTDLQRVKTQKTTDSGFSLKWKKSLVPEILKYIRGDTKQIN